jgi:hypothetical protein
MHLPCIIPAIVPKNDFQIIFKYNILFTFMYIHDLNRSWGNIFFFFLN